MLFIVVWGGFTGLNLATYNFTHTTQDQAIFLQVLHSILHHGSFAESIYHYSSFLRMHFSPIYLLLSPAALALPARWLVALFPLLAILVCARIARSIATRAGGSRRLAALVFVASLFNPLSVHLVEQGVRETLVAALFLALALEAFDRRRRLPFVVSSVLASLCKEDIPLVVAGFVVPALSGRRRGFWLWFPPVFGAGAFVVIVHMLMPWWGTRPGQGGVGFPFFEAMGSSYPAIALYLVTHAGEVLPMLLHESNRVFFRELVQGFWYVPLAAPELLLVPLSQYLEIALSASRHVADIHNWYYAPAYPFIVGAFARAVARAERLARLVAARDRPPRVQALARASVTAILAGALTASCAVPVLEAAVGRICFRGVVPHDATAGAASRLLRYRYYLARLAFFRAWAARVDRRLSAIPRDAPVSAQYPFLLAFAWRDHVTLFPDVEGARFVVLHRSLAASPLADPTEFRHAVWRLPRQGFRLAVEDGGLMIFERAPPANVPGDAADEACLEDCWRYEAETLPPGSWAAAGQSCVVRGRVDEAASGLAARRSGRHVPLPIGRFLLDLEPGRHTVRFSIRVREVFAASGFVLRLAAIDDEAGVELASRAVRRDDVTVGGRYQRLDLPLEIAGPTGRRVEIRVEDPDRASFLVDTVEVRRHRPQAGSPW